MNIISKLTGIVLAVMIGNVSIAQEKDLSPNVLLVDVYEYSLKKLAVNQIVQ